MGYFDALNQKIELCHTSEFSRIQCSVHIEIPSCPKTSLFYYFAAFIYQQKQSAPYWLSQELLTVLYYFFPFLLLSVAFFDLINKIYRAIWYMCHACTLQTYRVCLAQKHVQLSLVRRSMRTMKVKNFSFEIHPWFF